MGTADRIIRLIIAAILGGLFYAGAISGTLGIVLVILAVIFAFTGMVGFCPIYKVLGINSCPAKASSE